MIVHPKQCAACGSSVLKPFPFRRRDGVEIQFCVACGTGSVPDAELDFEKIYSPDYYLEAKEFGYPEDPPKRFVRSLLWKIFFLHCWAAALGKEGGLVQIIDIGAGISPARALVDEDREDLAWLDTDLSEFAENFTSRAFGPNDDRRGQANKTLLGFFEVLEHVEDPFVFLRENFAQAHTPGYAVIYVPNAGAAIAGESGATWGQLSASLEHTFYFSALGLERLLQRLGVGGSILTSPVGLLAVADLSNGDRSIRHFDDWVRFADQHRIPHAALRPFASIHRLGPESGDHCAERFDLLAKQIDQAFDGQLIRQPSSDESGRPKSLNRWGYGRLIEDYHWAVEVENAQIGAAPLEPFALASPKKAPSFRDRSLFVSKGGPLRVMYVAPKWDYGIPEQGWSYEHQNFYPTLYLSNCTSAFLHFDFVDFTRRHGRQAMSEHLVVTALRYQPDVIFIVFFNDEHDPLESALSLLSGDPTLSGTTVGWFSDDQYRFDDYTAKKAEFLNACITTLPVNDQRHALAGLADKVIYSAWAANEYYYQKPRTRRYRYDVSICGQPHSDRRVIVDLLRRSGIDVATFGTGWSQDSRRTFAEMLEIFQKTKVNLNPSLTAHGDPGQMKGRMFEVPACGRFLLTGETDGLTEFYDPQSEMPVYYDYVDLIEKVKLFLAHDDLRETIGSRAHANVLSGHTWEHRYRDMFQAIAPGRRFL